MNCRICSYGLLTVVLNLGPPAGSACFADDEPSIRPSQGTHVIGLTAGPFFPIRVTSDQSTKLFGGAGALSYSYLLTDPPETSWYEGQVSIGAELIGFGTSDPLTASGVGFTPKIAYSFVALRPIRLSFEGGGGPLWTDLGGRVPEQPGQFNFLIWGGAVCSLILTPHWAFDAGYRFVHISNAHTRDPNSGLNFGLPYLGLSYFLF